MGLKLDCIRKIASIPQIALRAMNRRMHHEKTSVVEALASVTVHARSQATAPLLANVDETTLNELALSYRILVNQGVLDAYGHQPCGCRTGSYFVMQVLEGLSPRSNRPPSI